MRKGRLHGFTLVEILIVLTIIGILAMLLFPMFRNVRAGAGRTTCASNLRQLGLAFQQYGLDNNNRFPRGLKTPDASQGAGWAGDIYPYVRSESPFRCPNDTGINNRLGSVSYAYNQALVRSSISNRRIIPSTKSWRAPGQTILLCEVSTDEVFSLSDPNEEKSPAASGLSHHIGPDAKYATGYLGGYRSWYNPSRFPNAEGRHNGRSVFLFCDGHVKDLRGDQVSPGLGPTDSRSGQSGTPQSGERLPNEAAGTRNPEFEATFSPR